MSAPSPHQSAAAAWTQALRTEQGASGERLARAMRDHDLASIGAPPGCLALISGSASHSDPRRAGEVALWLWGLLADAGLQEPARRLWGLQTGRFKPSAGLPRLYAPELASREIARLTLDVAVSLADSEKQPRLSERAPEAAPPAEAEAVGTWLASAIEGVGLSETARALWEHPDRAPVPAELLRRSGGALIEYRRELSRRSEDPPSPPPPSQ
jgi:hypothetical protein